MEKFLAGSYCLYQWNFLGCLRKMANWSCAFWMLEIGYYRLSFISRLYVGIDLNFLCKRRAISHVVFLSKYPGNWNLLFSSWPLFSITIIFIFEACEWPTGRMTRWQTHWKQNNNLLLFWGFKFFFLCLYLHFYRTIILIFLYEKTLFP